MNLPDQIEIQIVNEKGLVNPVGNILFGLRLFNLDFSWHNYSAFKTNEKGQVILTKQNIIDNTELKWQANLNSDFPTKVEIYVWKGSETDKMIKMTKRLLELYNDEKFIIKDLKNHKIPDENIPDALKVTQMKGIEDKLFYDLIKDAINNSINIQPIKIKDTWIDASSKKYKFVAKRFENAS